MRASKPKAKPKAKGTNKAKSTRQNTVKQRTTTPRLTAVQKELNRVQLSHNRGVFMKSLAVRSRITSDEIRRLLIVGCSISKLLTLS